MTRVSLMQFRAIGLLLCVLAWTSAGSLAVAQTAASSDLLRKASTLETRGRMDMAKQVWSQVLLSEPNNTEALAGMARAEKSEGHIDKANSYLAQLRAINPNDPNISKVENMGTAQDPNNLLREAGKLSQEGQYARAMALLKQVYGNEPPPGDAALSYYQTEAATEDTRPEAIAGLRALADKYPSDPRYDIALGKILTYNARTRGEGRKLLAKYPNDPDAASALRDALKWDQANPATAGDIRQYVQKHPDQELSASLSRDAQIKSAPRRSSGPSLTPEQKAANAERAAQGREVQEAYSALNRKDYSGAEQSFRVMLSKNPGDVKALEGMGYIRMNQANFAGAVSFFSEAEQNGARDAALEKALSDSRFYYTMREASGALAENDLGTAINDFHAALQMRPGDATALAGLGGTLLKAEQPEPAITVYQTYLRLYGSDLNAWRGLFLSYVSANQFDLALGLERRFPASIRERLMHDPDYLRTLASVYSATNRDAEAQRILQTALQLPFPADTRGLRADVEMQYAALLEAAGRHEQAAGLYREVLAADSTNTNAWVGLIQTEHAIGNDADAFVQLQQMPPSNYQAAMQEPGFATTVASIYMGQGHDDLAQSVLEEFLANQQANNQKPFVAAQVTLANLYLKHNDTDKAFPLFESILTNNPDRPDAWKGLLNSLHATGHNQEALAEIQQMPPDMRRQLEADPDYLQTVGSIYAALGHPAEAMRFLGRAESHYQAEGVAPPSDIDIQTAWLLFNAGNDPALYKQLMMLGGRPDLTDEQRRTVQTIWASWAVRRSQQSLAAGNPKRAIAILNAAAAAFPNNPAVLKALGSGYSAAGLNKEAIQIFKAQDLSTGTAADYRAAVGAALAANDLKDAEVWLRFGLEQYPKDSQLLGLAAKFEQARGNTGRAADYYRASLNAMPQPDPGAELAEALAKAPPPARLPTAEQPQDLASLLAQPDGLPRRGSQSVPSQPYLPGYGNTPQAPVILNRAAPIGSTPGYNPGGAYAPRSSAYAPSAPNSTYVAPGSGAGGYSYPSTTTVITPRSMPPTGMSGTPGYHYANPGVPESSQTPLYTIPDSGYNGPNATMSKRSTSSTIGDYVPQSSVVAKPLPGRSVTPSETTILHLHPSPAMEAKYGPYRSFVPGQDFPRDRASGEGRGSDAVAVSIVLPRSEELVSVKAQSSEAGLSYLAVSRVVAPRVETVSFVAQQQTLPDGTPVIPYAEVARPRRPSPPGHRATTISAQKAAAAQKKKAAAQAAAAQKKKAAAQAAAANNPFADFGVEPASQPAAIAPKRVEHTSIGHRASATQPAAVVTHQYVPPPIFIPGVTTPTSAHSVPPSHAITFPSESRAAAAAAAARRASAIHANQANAPLMLEGTSHPPVENYDTDTNYPAAQLSSTQFSTQPYSPSGMQGQQVPKPAAPSRTSAGSTYTQTTTSSSQDTTTSTPQSSAPTPGQQYPQPRTGNSSSGGATTTRRSHTRSSTTSVPAPVPVQPGAMSYPIYPQPLENNGSPETPPQYPLPAAPSDEDLRERNVPPLRGYFDPRVAENPKEPLTEREQTELNLALIEGSYSSWLGGSVIGSYRSGTPGIDRLTSLTVPFEASFTLGQTARLSIIPKGVFLNSGTLALNPNAAVAEPILGTLYNSQTTAVTQQFASGIGGEVQLVTSTLGGAIGYSPYGFPVSNLIGRARWRPGNSHFTFYGGRDSVTETMLSYAGLRDPNPNANGNIWGGVVANGGGVRFDAGDAKSGIYVQGEGADLTGYHVLENRKYDGTFGAYFRVKTWPEYGSLNIGGTVFGEHYDYNERGETYGLGGYFSPNVYFLAAVPITFNGHYKENLHYTINGSIGIQTFQEDSQVFFPLDGPSQAGVPAAACTPVCGMQVNSNTGANYSVDSELSYHVNEHWYVGGFLSGNNTNNYNTISGGGFIRYLLRPQVQTVDYPTGLFPVEGLRPLRVP
jgi:tetratricopeptide (TPR) repeat protein